MKKKIEKVEQMADMSLAPFFLLAQAFLGMGLLTFLLTLTYLLWRRI